MTGIVVTYAGALLQLVELARMEGCRDARHIRGAAAVRGGARLRPVHGARGLCPL